MVVVSGWVKRKETGIGSETNSRILVSEGCAMIKGGGFFWIA